MALVYVIAKVGGRGELDLARVPVKGDIIVGKSETVEVTEVCFTPYERVDAVVYAVAADHAVADDLNGAIKSLQKEANG